LTCVNALREGVVCNGGTTCAQPFTGGKKVQTTKFHTEPFTCPSCVKKIENVVGKKRGVESTQVMFNSNKVKVSFDENLITSEEIAQAITDLGYPVLSQQAG
jgi:copper chaperone